GARRRSRSIQGRVSALLHPRSRRDHHRARRGSRITAVTDIDAAIELNDRGLALRDAGDVAGAEAAYRSAMAAAPDWAAPVYNLGLLCKYECRWEESFTHNHRATELQPDDEASWWNLGIAATALSNWDEARRAWTACGIDVRPGSGPPQFN